MSPPVICRMPVYMNAPFKRMTWQSFDDTEKRGKLKKKRNWSSIQNLWMANINTFLFCHMDAHLVQLLNYVIILEILKMRLIIDCAGNITSCCKMMPSIRYCGIHVLSKPSGCVYDIDAMTWPLQAVLCWPLWHQTTIASTKQAGQIPDKYIAITRDNIQSHFSHQSVQMKH